MSLVFLDHHIAGGVTTWYILQSRDGYRSLTIPAPGYAVRGDFDGDGKADCAMIRSTSDPPAFWYIHKSSTNTLEIIHFGNTRSDYYVPGDYDGDGKTDPAIWRRGADTGQQSYFYILGSSRGFYGVPWGTNTDDVPLYYLQTQ